MLSQPAVTPSITSSTVHLLSLGFTASYVGSLYVAQHVFAPLVARRRPSAPPSSASSPAHAPSLAPSSRDHPTTIRLRMSAVGLSTLLSLSGVQYAVKKTSSLSWADSLLPALRLLGIPAQLSDIPTHPLSYALAPTLLLGPLAAMALDGSLPGQRNWIPEFGLVEARNYVVGPVTEELVFRSAVLAVSTLGGLSFRSLVFGTPLWFGIAHAHHALETFNRNGQTRAAAVQALAACAFQLTYTTLFGWFASYLFVKTGSVVPPLAAHVFCNTMGIYLPSTAAARHPRHKRLISAAYVTGVVGFVLGLRAF
ncbi:CAAX prenyl protease [Cryptotrichosporon argae]